MPRAFLITNRRYLAQKQHNNTTTSHNFKEHVHVIRELEVQFPSAVIPVADDILQKSPGSTGSYEIQKSPGSTGSYDGDSDSSYSVVSSDETRPDLSPKIDYNMECSEHISLLFDLITNSPRKPSCRDLYDRKIESPPALGFEAPVYTALTEPLSPLQKFTSQLDQFSHPLVDGNHKLEPHVCIECGKRYSTSSNLARHRQTHRSVSDKKARKCPHCDKVYVSMPAFSMHVRTHSQGCECPYCGKRFSRPWLLQGHIRTHTGEKPFKCPKCSKCFADKSNLRAHIQTHSTEKPYVCGRCGKSFALKSYLYKHEESSCMRGQRNKAKRVLQFTENDEPQMEAIDYTGNSW